MTVWDEITAIGTAAACVVAVGALIVSWLSYCSADKAAKVAESSLRVAQKELEDNRKHNELSMKPVLTMVRNITSTQVATLWVAQLILTNSGVGPAIIKSVELFFDGEKIECEPEKMWDAIVEKAIGRRFATTYHYFAIGPGYCISPDAKVVMLTLQFPVAYREEIKRLVKLGKCIIHYESLYEAPDTLDTSKNEGPRSGGTQPTQVNGEKPKTGESG